MQKKSLDSLKSTLVELNFRQEWTPRLVAYIRQAVKKGVVLVVLFGSRAKGEFTRDSDIDLLIVSPKAQADVRRRAVDFFCYNLPVQPFVLTPEELEQRIAKLDFLVFDAFEDGIILYSSMDLGRIRKLLRESRLKFGLERAKSGWRFDAEAAAAAGI